MADEYIKKFDETPDDKLRSEINKFNEIIHKVSHLYYVETFKLYGKTSVVGDHMNDWKNKKDD